MRSFLVFMTYYLRRNDPPLEPGFSGKINNYHFYNLVEFPYWMNFMLFIGFSNFPYLNWVNSWYNKNVAIFHHFEFHFLRKGFFEHPRSVQKSSLFFNISIIHKLLNFFGQKLNEMKLFWDIFMMSEGMNLDRIGVFDEVSNIRVTENRCIIFAGYISFRTL